MVREKRARKAAPGGRRATRPRRFELRTSVIGRDASFGALYASFWVDAETGREVSARQMQRAYRNLSATGLRVKCRLTAADRPHPWPLFGTITDINDTDVVLDARTHVPREKFHALYALE
jgi:hypothetical protein